MLHFPIYLDYNSTTPVDERVLKEMLPYFSKKFGNPASKTHSFGWEASEAVEISRERVAKIIHSSASEIFFTSGATESINLALKGVFFRYREKGNHIITCSTEHKAVIDTCKSLEKSGAKVTYLSVNKNGHLNLDELKKSITSKTILVSVMWANNETGVIHPVDEIAKIVHDKESIFMCDGTQAIGKIDLDVNKTGIDLLCFSSHKIYGPKGVGALFVRRKDPRVSLTPLIEGGGHEKGLRSGTLNVPGIVGFGKASELCGVEMIMEQIRLKKLRDFMENEFITIKGSCVNGDKIKRLNHVSNISLPVLDGSSLISGLKKLAIASGSACTSSTSGPSHVLKAMGIENHKIQSSLRFSFGRFTTEEEIIFAIDYVKKYVKSL